MGTRLLESPEKDGGGVDIGVASTEGRPEAADCVVVVSASLTSAPYQ